MQERRITSRDVPRILEALESNDPETQCAALRSLCPCRNRRYDREVWVEIFRAYTEDETGEVRDQAQHAIDTLIMRARTDPRSQELIRWLSEQEAVPFPLEGAIPVWRPRTAGLPPIPRWERSRRSRSNRRR
jgi:hypothetical protein